MPNTDVSGFCSSSCGSSSLYLGRQPFVRTVSTPHLLIWFKQNWLREKTSDKWWCHYRNYKQTFGVHKSAPRNNNFWFRMRDELRPRVLRRSKIEPSEFKTTRIFYIFQKIAKIDRNFKNSALWSGWNYVWYTYRARLVHWRID